MSWADTMRTGLEAVRAHRLRSALTVLGILIGIAAVILTVGLGQGAQEEVRKQIASLGSNLLIVSPGSSTSSSGIRGGFGSATTLTTAYARALSSKTVAPDIKAGKRVLIAAHGNSLRALVKFLDNVSEQEIVELNIPTGIPLVYQLNDDLKPLQKFYLGDQEAAARKAAAVASKGKAK